MVAKRAVLVACVLLAQWTVCDGFAALSLRVATLPACCVRGSPRLRPEHALFAMLASPDVVREPWALGPEHPAAQHPKIAGCAVPPLMLPCALPIFAVAGRWLSREMYVRRHA